MADDIEFVDAADADRGVLASLLGRPLTPPERATRLGHVVEWDPPHGLSSVERWTCVQCGSAVLRSNGNVYGSAVDGECVDA